MTKAQRYKPKVCAKCGKEFEAKGRNAAKYCTECSQPVEHRYCAVCGEELPKSKKKYCSSECRRMATCMGIKLSTGEKKVSTNERLLSTGKDLWSMAKEAAEHHMSYGKYIDWIEQKGRI